MSENENSNITVLQVNASWNSRNDINLEGLRNCRVQYAYLEDQTADFQSKINYVPVVIIYKGTRPVKQWTADLSFTLDLNMREVQEEVNKL